MYFPFFFPTRSSISRILRTCPPAISCLSFVSPDEKFSPPRLKSRSIPSRS